MGRYRGNASPVVTSVFVTFVRWHLQGDHVICHFLLASIHMSHSANHLLYGHCQMKYHMKYFSFLSWGQKPVWHPRLNNVWRKSKRIILQIVTQFENKYLPSFVCLIIPAHIFYSAFTSNFVVLDTLLWGWEVSLYHTDLGRFWLIIIFAGCKTSLIVTGTRGRWGIWRSAGIWLRLGRIWRMQWAGFHPNHASAQPCVHQNHCFIQTVLHSKISRTFEFTVEYLWGFIWDFCSHFTNQKYLTQRWANSVFKTEYEYYSGLEILTNTDTNIIRVFIMTEYKYYLGPEVWLNTNTNIIRTATFVLIRILRLFK